ncbi:hypothetical protein Tco_0797477 [Tanacetum coccineum]
MDWLIRCHAVIVCDEKLVQVPYGNETLTFCGNESSNGSESRLTVISCSKAQEYMAKGCQVFLAQISAKKEEDNKEFFIHSSLEDQRSIGSTPRSSIYLKIDLRSDITQLEVREQDIIQRQHSNVGQERAMKNSLKCHVWNSSRRKVLNAKFQKENDPLDKLARLYLNRIVAIHEIPISIIYDRDGRFTAQFWKTFQKALETTENIVLIKQRIQAAQDRQKSYADLKRKTMEFEVGDRVMLKVSPWKGVVHFGKRGKLNPRYVRPFKVLAKVGKVAYKLELPQELSRVHHTFHVSNLKKCYADKPLVMSLEGIHVDDKLQYVEEPVEIMEREIKRLNQSRIPLVKV